MGREIRRLAWQIAAHAEWQRASGVQAIPYGMALPAARERGALAAADPAPGVPVTRAADLDAAPGAAFAAATDLAGLQAAIGDCQRCRLAKGRTNLVFGVGNPRARLMFVGEGPGRDED